MTDGPSGERGDNPFQGMPLFGDLARMLQQQGPVAWDAGRQLALSIASSGETEPNVDPLRRITFEQLTRVADLHVTNVTGLSTTVEGRPVEVVPVNRTQWANQTLDDLRPLVEELAGSLGPKPSGPPGSEAHPTQHGAPGLDPEADGPDAWLSSLMQMLSPMMLGMTAGSLVGRLATRSFGQHEPPLPRPRRATVAVVVANLDAFGREWSLDVDNLTLWVCLHELTYHAVMGVSHVRARLDALLREWAAAFATDPHGLENRLGDLEAAPGEDPMAGLQQLLSDPEVLLGAVRTPAQAELQPRLEALVCVITGYVDHVMDRIGSTLISSYGMVTEAMRRRRVEASSADRFVERLFGLELTQGRYDRGTAFIDGIVERAGETALDRLWASEADLPTPAEVDAPGLWLARIDLPPAT